MKKLWIFFLLTGTVFLYAEKPKLYSPVCEQGFFYAESKGFSTENIISVKTKGIPDGKSLRVELCKGKYSKNRFERNLIHEFPLVVKDGAASTDLDLRYIPRKDGRQTEVKLYFIVKYDSTGCYYEDDEVYENLLSKEEVENMIRLEVRSPEYNLYDKYVFKITDYYLFPFYGYTFELTDGFETITKVYENNPDGTLVFDKVMPGHWQLKMAKDQSALEKYLKKHPEDETPKNLDFEMDTVNYFWSNRAEMELFGAVGMRNDVNWVFIGSSWTKEFIYINGNCIRTKN